MLAKFSRYTVCQLGHVRLTRGSASSDETTVEYGMLNFQPIANYVNLDLSGKPLVPAKEAAPPPRPPATYKEMVFEQEKNRVKSNYANAVFESLNATFTFPIGKLSEYVDVSFRIH